MYEFINFELESDLNNPYEPYRCMMTFISYVFRSFISISAIVFIFILKSHKCYACKCYKWSMLPPTSVKNFLAPQWEHISRVDCTLWNQTNELFNDSYYIINQVGRLHDLGIYIIFCKNMNKVRIFHQHSFI